ncbi:acyltransferase family protein [Chryseobacterium tongliaoense]|uniref:acyltransferase family protein n=1 Tax=Chryseobacterium tongliaoense TaxID=3240933 RepID=UPI003517A595
MNHFSERLYGLDHLRALAIVLVLMYHYRAFEHPAWIDTGGRFGWTGVDLFFVLSGFLISGQLFKEIEKDKKISLKRFYIKRFFRIIPPYLFTLALYFCIPFFREREMLPPFWKFITFTQNYGLDIIDYGTFSHAWSLCIEEQFYLLLPLILLILMKTRFFKYFVFLSILLIAFSLSARFVEWYNIDGDIDSGHFWKSWYMQIYYPTHTRLDGLVTGVLISYLLQYSSKFREFVHHNGNALFISGVIVLAFSFWICDEQASRQASIFGFTFVALSYGLMVMGAISKSSFLSRSKYYITTQLAGISYTVYLSHKGIIHITQNILEYLNFQVSDSISLCICLLVCIAVGLFYRYFIEKPSSFIKNKLLMNKNKSQDKIIKI